MQPNDDALSLQLLEVVRGYCRCLDQSRHINPNPRYRPTKLVRWSPSTAHVELGLEYPTPGTAPWTISSACYLSGDLAMCLSVKPNFMQSLTIKTAPNGISLYNLLSSDSSHCLKDSSIHSAGCSSSIPDRLSENMCIQPAQTNCFVFLGHLFDPTSYTSTTLAVAAAYLILPPGTHKHG
jgi:hypothetical protein